MLIAEIAHRRQRMFARKTKTLMAFLSLSPLEQTIAKKAM
jgi:hypothetical protein